MILWGTGCLERHPSPRPPSPLTFCWIGRRQRRSPILCWLALVWVTGMRKWERLFRPLRRRRLLSGCFASAQQSPGSPPPRKAAGSMWYAGICSDMGGSAAHIAFKSSWRRGAGGGHLLPRRCRPRNQSLIANRTRHCGRLLPLQVEKLLIDAGKSATLSPRDDTYPALFCIVKGQIEWLNTELPMWALAGAAGII